MLPRPSAFYRDEEYLPPSAAVDRRFDPKELASQIRYLKIDNQILRSKLPSRVQVAPQERTKLVKFGSKLGKALGEMVTIVHPDTLRRWIRESKQVTKRKAAKTCSPSP